jgi:predicted ATPase/DNA-binding winged helix-turn-helix (wHTH) protein
MITTGPTAHQHLLGARGLHLPEANRRRYSLRIDQHASCVVDRAAAHGGRAIAFGPFDLLPTRRLLLKAGQSVRLGSRALDILIALVERPGELVSKGDLMARVWPHTFVVDGNLKVQVAALRRALGDTPGSNRYLATIHGRGYRFVAPVTLSKAPRPPAPERAAGPTHNLLVPVARIVDRADTVGTLTAQLPHQRFVTIVGPGGIGKTTAALAVAERLSANHEHGVRFVDLATVGEPLHLPVALASVLGLEAGSEQPGTDLIAFLKDKQMLLVLDNCEHVIEAAADVAVRILRGAPGVRILATSREVLRAEGEHVHRLPPLACPPPSAGLTAADALRFPAVQLFVECEAAFLGEFELADHDAPLVADICRRLDGLPLAIQLAAARVDALGLRGLTMHLDDRLQLLTGGRRPAVPRHQSLRATLEWSHRLLSRSERAVFRRLAIFADGFTLAAAGAIAASAEIGAPEVVDCVANLVAKSIVAADVDRTVPSYRLLETTRAYALEKLHESGEFEQVQHRHAASFEGSLQSGRLK